MKYISTRGGQEVNSSSAIIQGIAEDKGLFVPESFPELAIPLDKLAHMNYREVAKEIIGSFFDDFTEEEIEECVNNAYLNNFDAEDVVPVVSCGDAFFLELYHGRTSAFKDMALSILPYLLTTAAKKNNEEKKICILTATSGDTGKAALEGFSDVPGTEIIVFYPEEGVSEVQKKQMITQAGDNTHVFAIKGNFDDAQTGVKRVFNDGGFLDELGKRGYRLSSANSINIGRLIPQVVYYVYGYGRLIERGVISPGDSINVVVPTGNFGNILAAYYAGRIGIPINKYICASNENKVLTDFLNSGCYDARREFHITNSPSMDILISSNLERLLYHLSEDHVEIARLMKELEENKCYQVSDEVRRGLSCFYGGYADIIDTNKTIGEMYKTKGYLLDTHTAVAYKVYRDYLKSTCDARPTLIAATASPFKFSGSVSKSLGLEDCDSEFEYLNKLSEETGIIIPMGLKDLDKKEVHHSDVIRVADMEKAILDCLE